MFGTYERLNVHIYASNLSVIRAARRKLAKSAFTMAAIGSKLRNGTTVLAYKEVGEMPFNRGPLAEGIPTARAIVMAYTGDDAAMPFVTWAMNVDDGSTYWGHYYKTAKEAWGDFNERW